jgi:N-acetylmuramoyl-L-alanine amidase
VRLIDWVVVHTAAAYDWKNKRVVYQSTQTIRSFHQKTNGWPDIGYHWVIEEDGATVRGLLEEQMGSHVGGFNKHSIGICVTGHGDFAPFKPAQLASLVRLAARICDERKLPGSRVIGHRETDDFGGPPVSKTCPGLLVDMDEIRRLVAARLEAA